MITFSNLISLMCFGRNIVVHHPSLSKPISNTVYYFLQDCTFDDCPVHLFDVTSGGVVHIYLSV